MLNNYTRQRVHELGHMFKDKLAVVFKYFGVETDPTLDDFAGKYERIDGYLGWVLRGFEMLLPCEARMRRGECAP